MQSFLRRIIKNMAIGIELVISLLLSLVIIYVVISTTWEMVFSGNIVNYRLEYFLTQSMTLAIGVELVKMLSTHTPSTIIEVLLFAISREMVVEELSMTETIIGVAAIAGLFAIRKFLFSSMDDTKAVVVRGSQTIGFANFVAKTNIPEDHAALLRDVVRERIEEDGRTVAIGACVNYKGCVLRIDHMKNDIITRVEVIRSL